MLHELRTAAVIHATSPERGMESFSLLQNGKSFSILSISTAAVACSRRSDSRVQAKS